MRAILEKLWDETARIERVIFLAGALGGGDSFPDDLNDFFDDNDKKDIEKCLGKVPEYVDLSSKGFMRADSIYEWLTQSRKFGFLVQFATPVMTPISKDSRSFSWGYYRTAWIYGESIEEAIEKGMKWVKARRSDEDRKAKKKGGA